MTTTWSARLLMVAVMASIALPSGGAGATEHCTSPIAFLTGTGLLTDPRNIGCDIIAEDFSETPGDDSDTRWILPGTTSGVVWWIEGSVPVNGSVIDGVVHGSRIEILGQTIALRFVPGEGLSGNAVLTSQDIPVGRSQSLTVVATITVCRDEACEDSETAVYRGVAAPA